MKNFCENHHVCNDITSVHINCNQSRDVVSVKSGEVGPHQGGQAVKSGERKLLESFKSIFWCQRVSSGLQNLSNLLTPHCLRDGENNLNIQGFYEP